MRVLFAHQSFPSQFKYLAPSLAKLGHQVVFMSAPTEKRLPGVAQHFYTLGPEEHCESTLLKPLADALRYGLAARQAATSLAEMGFSPDVIVAHPGWGEALFLKDVFGSAHLVSFLELFFTPEDSFFDFASPSPDIDTRALLHMRNGPLLEALIHSSWNIAPTEWQRNLFPDHFMDRTTVIHEGINVSKFAPTSGAELRCDDGTLLKQGMEVVTFVARYLEPIRGLKSFLMAAELILKQRPKAHIVVVGHDRGGYGDPPPKGCTHKEVILGSCDLDRRRVHFMGCVGQSIVVKVLQMSTVHVFLTYPFLISYSVLEALACECVLIASDTGPVREIVADGTNGLVVDFFDAEQIANLACSVLARPEDFALLGRRGRDLIARKYNALINVNRQIELIRNVAARDEPPFE